MKNKKEEKQENKKESINYVKNQKSKSTKMIVMKRIIAIILVLALGGLSIATGIYEIIKYIINN